MRAAAFSALRAGLRPWCADLFADNDLSAVCQCKSIEAKDYPRGLCNLLRQTPPTPWMYTGGLENYPELIDRMSRQHPLWGNPADVLRRIRSPVELATILGRHGIECPRVIAPPDEPGSGIWLRKPLKSAGGIGIQLATSRGRQRPQTTSRERQRPEFYFQQFVKGAPHSAVYIGNCGQAELLGVTRQLVGERWLNAAPFGWCGNVGPISLPIEKNRQLQRIGNVLTNEFSLRGLFGVDIILREGSPIPVEVNPRYPASAEVVEWGLHVSFLAKHRAVFDDSVEKKERADAKAKVPSRILGKAVLFAPRDVCFPSDGPWRQTASHASDVWRRPRFADVPRPHTHIAANRPILTVTASGDDETDCLNRLRLEAGEVYRVFDSHACR